MSGLWQRLEADFAKDEALEMRKLSRMTAKRALINAKASFRRRGEDLL
jgi:hypothetical protein